MQTITQIARPVNGTPDLSTDVLTNKALPAASADAMVDWLGWYPWCWYYTQTFYNRHCPHYVTDQTGKGFDLSRELLPGERQAWRSWEWVIKQLRGEYGRFVGYFVAIEDQLRGAAHYHAILLGIPDDARFASWGLMFYKRYGWCKFKMCNTRPELRQYVSKYVVKEQAQTARWAMDVPPQDPQRKIF